MKKTSKAFQLDPMPESVTIKLNPKDKQWYPMDKTYNDGKTTFICGQGWIKTGKWKEEIIQPLSNPFTAKELKEVKDAWGFNVALGMIQGCGSSVFSDQSVGLSCVKYELANMATLGESYDTFTNYVQEVGDKFIDNLLQKRFTLHGNREKGFLWYDYKDENDCGHLVGGVGIYEKIHLHPLQHVEHLIGVSILGGRILPSFDPISFDEMLVTLFQYKYYSDDFKKSRKMLDKYVSVHDRIEHLTTKTIADSFERIFEMQKELKVLDKAR